MERQNRQTQKRMAGALLYVRHAGGRGGEGGAGVCLNTELARGCEDECDGSVGDVDGPLVHYVPKAGQQVRRRLPGNRG
jgi:hypothetical protein